MNIETKELQGGPGGVLRERFFSLRVMHFDFEKDTTILY